MEDLKQELKRTVENWIDRTFNTIHVEVIKRTLAADNEYLHDYIEPLDIDFNDFIQNYNLYDNYKEWLKENEFNSPSDGNDVLVQNEYMEQTTEYERYKENQEDNNYPMWNYCFELKYEYEEVINKAQKAGFGIINSSDYLHSALFVAGAGYSFLSHHWIPLYLSLYSDEAKKYKDIKYSDL